ncbi:autotransporter family protein [Halovulum sp. GXIMD14793]
MGFGTGGAGGHGGWGGNGGAGGNGGNGGNGGGAYSSALAGGAGFAGTGGPGDYHGSNLPGANGVSGVSGSAIPGLAGQVLGSGSAGIQGNGGDVSGNTVTNAGMITANGYGVSFIGGNGTTQGLAFDNRVYNLAGGAIAGDVGVFFGAGTGNFVETAGDITGTSGTAIEMTSGTNELRFLRNSVTTGAVQGGTGDDTFVLHNNARITGTIHGDNDVTGDVLALAFTRVLPSEYTNIIQKLKADDTSFDFRFQTYTFDGIEKIDISMIQLSDFGRKARTPNQKAMGRTLDNLPYITPDLDNFLALVDASSDVTLALRQMTPELYGVGWVASSDIIRHLERSDRGRLASQRGSSRLAFPEDVVPSSSGGGVMADAEPESNLWFETAGLFGDGTSKTNLMSYQSSAWLARFGIDINRTSNAVVGLSMGWSESSTASDSFSAAAPSSIATKSVHVTAYGQQVFDNGLYLNGQLQFGLDSYSGHRNLQVGADARSVQFDYDGKHWAGNFALGIERQLIPNVMIDASAGLAYASLWTEAFTETGAGDLSLRVKEQHVESMQSVISLGAHGEHDLADGSTLRFRGRASWRHEFAEQGRINADLIAIPGSGFTISGPSFEKDILSLEAGISIASPNERTNVYLNASGDYFRGGKVKNASVEAGISFTF